MGRKRVVRYKASGSEAEKPLKHFYNTISYDDLEDKKMKLPNAFVNEFGGELSDVVKVVDPGGHIWEIGLTKSEKHIWFDNGWYEFVQRYSIGTGFLLFFGYRGLSNFSVVICDMMDYEIQYPHDGPKGIDQGPLNGEKCSIDDTGHDVVNTDYVENIGSTCLRDRVRRILKEKASNAESSKRAEQQREETNEQYEPTGASSKIRKSNSRFMERSKKKMMEEQVEEGISDARKFKRGKFDEQGKAPTWLPFVDEGKDGENELSRRRDAEVINTSMFTSGFRLASAKSETAIQNARKFKTKHPCLMVVLRPHHLYNYFLHLPGEFAKKYMSNVPQYIKLRACDDREWVARIGRARTYLTIGSGIRFFLKENNLDEGDVLVLEWIKKDNTMKISIFRAVEEAI